MKKVTGSNQQLCVGCNKCTRKSPIKMVNLTYQDEENNIRAKRDNTKCIACGACISLIQIMQ